MGEGSDNLTRGLAAYKARDYEAAVSELEQATLKDHENFQAFLYLGAAYAGAGRHNAAIGAFRRAAELRPDDARTHYNLGQAYEAAGVPREALYEYSRALGIDPRYTLARTAYSSLISRLARQNAHRMRISA